MLARSRSGPSTATPAAPTPGRGAPSGRDELAPPGLGCHPAAYAQRHVRDPAEPALDRHVGPAPDRGLERVEREAVVRVHNPGHAGPAGGHAADRARLGAVGVHHVEIPLAEDRLQPAGCQQIAARGDHLAEQGLDQHLDAGGGGLLDQPSPAASHDRGRHDLWVQHLGAAQGEYTCSAFEPGDYRRDPQRTAPRTHLPIPPHGFGYRPALTRLPSPLRCPPSTGRVADHRRPGPVGRNGTVVDPPVIPWRPGGGRRPAARATRTASSLLCTSSLLKMLRVWVRTVSVEISSSSAICRPRLPSAMLASTSRSRGLSTSSGSP